MFFSTDLLSIRGGKMCNVWLLGTTKDREALIKKKKSQLLKTDLRMIVEELVKRFPVHGKEHSFSLRMSAILVYGTCINLRVQAEDLRKATYLLITKKNDNLINNIDLPGQKKLDKLILMEPEFPEADINLGNMASMESDFMQLDLDNFNVRARISEITMSEIPPGGLIDYNGPELPLLSAHDILNETWNLDDNPKQVPTGEVVDRAPLKRLPVSPLASSSKRTRSEVNPTTGDIGNQVETQPEETVIVADETQHVDAPARLRMPSVPDIIITPAVTQERIKKTGHQLDMEEVVNNEDDTVRMDAAMTGELVDQHILQEMEEVVNKEDDTVRMDAAMTGELGDLNILQEFNPDSAVVERDDESEMILQAIVSKIVKKIKTKKITTNKIDINPQLSSSEIRDGLANYMDTLRCETTDQDFFHPNLPQVLFTSAGRDLGATLDVVFKEYLRVVRHGTVLVWDREVNQEQENVDVGIAAEDIGPPVAESTVLDKGTTNANTSNIETERRVSTDDPSLALSEQTSKLDLECPTNIRDADQLQVSRTDSKRNSSIETSQPDIPNQNDDNEQPLVIIDNTRLSVLPTIVEDQEMVVVEDIQDGGQNPVLDHPLLGSRRADPYVNAEDSMILDISLSTVMSDLTKTSDRLFSSLCPPSSTDRGVAAVTFMRILQMERIRQVKIDQEENYGEMEIHPIL